MSKSVKTEHTGFRNGDLFCFNCGDAHSLGFPLPVDEAAAKMKAFAKRHEDCPKTWQEPKPETPEQNSEMANEEWWATKGEHGISSKTMFNALCRGRKLENSSGPRHPSDPDDFRRCYLLLKAIPQWRSRLYILRNLSPVWAGLVDNWDTLTEMLETSMKSKSGKAREMFDLMQSLGC